MTLDPSTAVPLPGDVPMPLLGFGTWQLRGTDARRAVGWALEAGYRHLDTATMYENETEVGAAVAESGLAREDVFVTTKLPPERAGRERETLRASLDALGTDHVDLWLIHAPPGGAGVEVWQEFVAAREDGLARAIGVSNYALGQLDELTRATGVTPAVNQIRWSPLLFDRPLLDGTRERGTALEGYSGFKGGTLAHPVVTGIAERLGRTPAQVVVRWHLQHGVVVIPKSGSQERIASNADVYDFSLDDDDLAALDGLSGR